MKPAHSSFGLEYASSFFAPDNRTVFVLSADGTLWLEHAVDGKFGQVPPPREQVDSNVQAFQVLDGNNVLVLGTDDVLWLEHPVGGKFGKVPPPREQIDGDVLAFQALDGQTVVVLGTDGRLWREHAVNGKFGAQVPPPRELIDGPPGAPRVIAFQAIDANTIFVLDSEQMLHLNRGGGVKELSPREPLPHVGPPADVVAAGIGGPQPSSSRELVGEAVSAFQAMDANTVYILDPDAYLRLSLRSPSGSATPWPGDGVGLDGDVAAFQAVPSGNASVLLVYTSYLAPFIHQSAAQPGSFVRQVFALNGGTASRTSVVNVDMRVLDFQVIEPEVVILGRDGNLWITTGAFGETVPPPRAQIDGNVRGPTAYGQVRPSYQVLTVIYAPPGTNGGKSSSTVDYSTGSTTGTTISTSSSFKAGLDVKLGVGNDATGTVSADFNFSRTVTDGSSVEVSKSETLEIKAQGPSSDGIDHDSDIYYLWLNPLIHVASDTQSGVSQTLDVDGAQMNIQWVSVGWLKNPTTMPAGVKAQLDAAGLRAADYKNLLNSKVNPFAMGATAIDPSRFLPLPETFPYEPPTTSTNQVPTTTYQVKNSATNTNTQQQQVQYGVSVSASTGKAIVTLQSTASFTWTNTASQSQQQQNTQSASVTVGGPAYGYTGPTNIRVYWDTVYNSFMFAFA